MSLIEKEMKIKITLIEEILGTAPSDPELYKSYVAGNAPDAPTMQEEIEAFGVDEVAEKPRTVFCTDKDGNKILYDYQIKGFFKDACGALRDNKKTESGKLTAYKKKIDGLIFVTPRQIKFGGDVQFGDCQRPLRAQTAQGERVAIAVSDTIGAGATLEFSVLLMKGSMEKVVREWLDYGMFKGLGQWRNSGKGKFTYEVLEVIKHTDDE